MFSFVMSAWPWVKPGEGQGVLLLRETPWFREALQDPLGCCQMKWRERPCTTKARDTGQRLWLLFFFLLPSQVEPRLPSFPLENHWASCGHVFCYSRAWAMIEVSLFAQSRWSLMLRDGTLHQKSLLHRKKKILIIKCDFYLLIKHN